MIRVYTTNERSENLDFAALRRQVERLKPGQKTFVANVTKMQIAAVMQAVEGYNQVYGPKLSAVEIRPGVVRITRRRR